ncbi:MAG: fsr 2 [Anaerosporomusa subterranea]|jgi:FSR family fosmidomycin resistance protein-like MFS transporter|nr:fsr 2 [Anaerosporomusa subterranea]
MLIERLGLSLTVSGLLVMVYSAASNILQPVFGYFVDKSGYTWIVLLTIPLAALFISLAATADSVSSLFVYITLAGLASALFHPLGSALLGKVSTEENKGLSMSVFIGGGNIGVALAPAVVIYFLLNYGAHNLIWLAIPGFLLSMAFYLTGIHKVKLVSPQKAAAVIGGTPWYRSASLIKLNLVMGLRSWPQAVIPNFLPVWLVQKGFPPTLAGTMLTVFLAGGAIGSVFGGYVGDKLGRKRCIIGALALCVPALYVFLMSHEVTSLTWIALGVSGAALQGTLPSSIVWAQDMLPTNAAMASGMMLGLSFGLGGLGAAVTGAVADSIGLEQALIWMIAPLLLGLAITISIPEKTTESPAVATTVK